MMIDSLSPRDRAILLAEVAPQIAELRPLTVVAASLGHDWRPTFKSEADRWRQVANGRPSGSAARQDALHWASAHEFVLAEAS